MPGDIVTSYLGPSPLAKVLEAFVPKDLVILCLGPSPLAKVLETFVLRGCVILHAEPSPLAKVQETFVPKDYVTCRAFALGQSVRNLCAQRLCYMQGLRPWQKYWKPLCPKIILDAGPSPSAKVLEKIVTGDCVMSYVGLSPLAKVFETFAPRDYVVIYLGPSPFAFEQANDRISILFHVQSI